MTKEELLKPRFRAIADFPFNKHFKIGSIITLEYIDERGHLAKSERYAGMECIKEPVTALNLNFYETDFEKYPHLFERLDWWEERKEIDLPNYILVIYKEVSIDSQLKPEVYKCYKWFNKTNDVYPYVNENYREVVSMGTGVYPATEQEYKEQQIKEAKQ